jgi:hypothetical protein
MPVDNVTHMPGLLTDTMSDSCSYPVDKMLTTIRVHEETSGGFPPAGFSLQE